MKLTIITRVEWKVRSKKNKITRENRLDATIWIEEKDNYTKHEDNYSRLAAMNMKLLKFKIGFLTSFVFINPRKRCKCPFNLSYLGPY